MIGIYRGLVAEALTAGARAAARSLGGRGRHARPLRRSLAHPRRHARGGRAHRRRHWRRAPSPISRSRAEHARRASCGSRWSATSRAGPAARPRSSHGRPIARSRYEMVADRGTGLVSSASALPLGRATLHGRRADRRAGVVGRRSGRLSSRCGTARSCSSIWRRRPPARELARGAARRRPATSSTPSSPASPPTCRPTTVAEAVRRWKHLGALTQDEQETILTRSVVERARRQIGLFTSILLHRLDGDHRADHLHADHGQDAGDRHAEADRRARPHHRRPDRAAGARAWALIGFVFGAALDHRRQGLLSRAASCSSRRTRLALGVVVLVVCLLASSLGVRLALKVDPATALGG